MTSSESSNSDDFHEDSIGAQRFEGLSAAIRALRESEHYQNNDEDLFGKLVTLTSLAQAACEMRKRCYEEGAKLGAYNDDMSNYYLGEIVCLVVGSTRRALSVDEVAAAEELLEAVFWLFADSAQRYAPGDWLKRLGDAVLLLRRSHPVVRALADDLIGGLSEPWRNWLVDPNEDDSLDAGTTGDMFTESADDDELVGASILNFHQAMWLQECETPLAIPPTQDSAQAARERIWGDQEDFELYLAEAWHARRTDDWSFFKPLIATFAAVDIAERWRQPRAHALYNALNHLLLYGGDGQHPVAALGELLDADDEYDHLGGFTYSFKDCWKPLLLEMWLWWTRSGFAPHGRAGTPVEWVDRDLFWVTEPKDFRFDDGDSLHLSGHCGGPLGQDWTDAYELETAGTFLQQHEPTIYTLHTASYRNWMAVLRTMPIDEPVFVKVMIDTEAESNSSSPQIDGPVIGYWLVQPFQQEHPHWANHARYITDEAAPAVYSLVRTWQWELPENAPDADDSEDDQPGSAPLGLFDGIEEADLLGMVLSKETLFEVIVNAIPATKNTFTVSVSVDEQVLGYVQAIVEDERDLHVELAHESFLETTIAPDRRKYLVDQGWNEPEENLPNYWQLLNREDWSDVAIAQLLVNALDYVYGVFTNMPDNAIVEVQPLEVALAAVPDYVTPVAIDLPNGGGRIEIPDGPPED